jgi:enamine deaminase RidA (YjgF/YER057c/UK114 family)
MEFLQPQGWKPAKGYANGVIAEGRVVFLGGQIGWNEAQVFESDDFIDQFRQTLHNIVVLLAAAGGGPENLVRLTWFITDRDAYLNSQKEMGRVYRQLIGRHFPAMSVVQVVKLVEERALIEIEATAVLS